MCVLVKGFNSCDNDDEFIILARAKWSSVYKRRSFQSEERISTSVEIFLASSASSRQSKSALLMACVVKPFVCSIAMEIASLVKASSGESSLPPLLFIAFSAFTIFPSMSAICPASACLLFRSGDALSVFTQYCFFNESKFRASSELLKKLTLNE
jgi:hypothetical protein